MDESELSLFPTPLLYQLMEVTSSEPTAEPTAAPQAPGVRPYTIVNYVLCGFDFLLALVALLLLAREVLFRRNQNEGHTQRLLFIHSFAWALSRGILCLLPLSFYRRLLQNEPAQAALDLFPELLFQLLFIVLNLKWTQLYLRLKGVRPEKSLKYFTIGYILLSILLWVGAGILVYVIYKKGPSKSGSFWDSYTTWEVLYYATASLFIYLSNVIFGVGFLFRLKKLPPIVVMSLRSKISKFRFLVYLSLVCVGLKTIFQLVLNNWIREAYKQGILSNTGFAGIWFLYFFLFEQFPVACIFVIFGIPKPSKWNSYDSNADSNDNSRYAVMADHATSSHTDYSYSTSIYD